MQLPSVRTTAPLCLVVFTAFTAIFPDQGLPQWLANRKQNFRDMTCKFVEPLSVDTQECNQWLREIEQKARSKLVDILRKLVRKTEELLALNPEVDLDNVFNYTEEKDKLNETEAAKGEAMINAMKFSEYDETNLCDVWKGVEVSEFDADVDSMADLVNMPEHLTKMIKKAKNFRNGKATALNKLAFRDEMGNLVFGRFVIARSGDQLDFAYSLHSVRYVARKRQLTEETQKYAAQLLSLADSMDENTSAFIGQIIADGTNHDITIAQRNAFLAFFS